MATITTRAGKGSPLTNDEVDANFTNLNTDKAELSGASFTGNVSFGDNDKAIFGVGSDLQIFHNGTSSIIQDAGTGNLIIQATELQITNANNTANYIRAFDGGAVDLRYAGSAKLATTSTGIDVTGTVVADGIESSGGLSFTAADGIDISGKESVIIRIDSDDNDAGRVFQVRSGPTSSEEILIQAVEDAGVSLYYDNAAKIVTTSTGIDVTGYTNNDSVTTSAYAFKSQSNSTSASTHSWFRNPNGFIGGIGTNGSDLTFVHSGSANEKLRINSTGIDVTGTAVTDGVTVAGDYNQSRTAGTFFTLTDTTNSKTGYINWESDAFNIFTHGPVKRLTIDSSGIDVTGSVEADGGNFTGQVQFNGTAGIQLDDGAQVHTWTLDDNITSRFNIGTSSASAAWIFGSNNANYWAVSPSGVVVNQDSGDTDFRVESDSNTHMLFVDAGTNRVGIGGTPQARVEIVSDGSDSAGAELRLTHANNNTNDVISTLNFANNAGSAARIRASTTGANNTGLIQFFTDSAGTDTQVASFKAEDIVFNETSANMDFRVESDGASHMLFVDAGNNRVGIGESQPTATLHVKTSESGASPNGNADDLFVENSGNAGITIGSGSSSAGQIRFADSESSGRGIVYYDQSSDLMALYTAGAERFRITSASAVFNEYSNDQDFRVESDTNTHALFVDAGNNKVSVGGSTPYGGALNVNGAKNVTAYASDNQIAVTDTTALAAGVGGAINFNGVYTTSGDVTSAAVIEASKINATTAHWGFGLNLRTRTHGANSDSRLYLDQNNTVFNETGADTDFRVESNGNANMLFVDAENNRIGVKTNSPVKPLSLGSRTGANLSYIFGTSQTLNEDNGVFVSGSTSDVTNITYGLHLANNNNTNDAYSPVIGFSALSASNGYNHAYAYIAGYKAGTGADTNWNTGGIQFLTSSGTGPNTRLNINYLGGLITTPTTGGHAVFNESSVDADFRVESNGNSHCLLVDAGTSKIGINQPAPDYQLHVGDGTQGNRVHIQANGGGAIFSGVDSVNNSGSGFRWGHLNGTDRLEGALGTTEIIDWRKTAFYFKPNSTESFAIGTDFVTVNNQSLDLDFRVESDSNANMLFVNAGTNRIGMGTNVPVGSLHLKDVRDSNGSDVYYVAQNTTSNRLAGYQVLDESGTVSLKMEYDNGGNGASIINPNNGSLAVYLGGTAAANALDDYEEGTWTPTINTNNNNASMTVGNSTGYYTKIGNVVTLTWYSNAINVTNIGSGIVIIGGLPFTASNGSIEYGVGNCAHTTVFNATGGYIGPNGTIFIPISTGTASGVSLILGNPKYVMFEASYRTV